MKKDYAISIYLDTRRVKSNGKYPVKLRVFTSTPRKQKLYPTTFELTEKEFEQIWKTTKPRNEFKDIRRQISSIENKACSVADKITPFLFEQFEKKLYRKDNDGISVTYHYAELIQELKKREQINTADTYRLSEKSIKRFVEATSRKKYDKLTLLDITPEWLKDYEQYFVKTEKKTLTTVSMYLRVLRTIFNKAISEGEIDPAVYPFGRRKYQVPATKNVKKALSKDELKRFFEIEPKTQGQKKAKDFWFFSYSCNGMNFKDIAQLKYKDIQDGKIEFVRAKTALTSKANLKPITVYLNDFTNKVIAQYGNSDQSSENYVFDILRPEHTPEQKQRRIKDFITCVNRRLQDLCQQNDLPADISTYWARHSFATKAVRSGASMEFIQESLGHGNVKTTQNYFAGFDSEIKKELAESIMNFD